MSETQNPLQTGRNCRFRPAGVAGGNRARQSRRRLAWSPQFPPPALFAALARAGIRQAIKQRNSGGTEVAIR